MDPKANIERQRELAAVLLNMTEHPRVSNHYGTIGTCAHELAELVVALDEWRTKGGFDPYAESQRVHVALWTDDGGEPQAQVYRTLEGATRDFHDSYPNVTIAASTVQP